MKNKYFIFISEKILPWRWLAPTSGVLMLLAFSHLWYVGWSHPQNKLDPSYLVLTFGILYPILLSLSIACLQWALASKAEVDKARATLEALPLALLQTSTDGTWTSVNTKWYRLTGQSPVHAQGEGWQKCVASGDLEKWQTEFEIAQFRGVGFKLPMRLFKANKTQIWTEFTIQPQPTMNPLHKTDWLGIVEERTQEQQTETLLKASLALDHFLCKAPSHREIIKKSLALLGPLLDFQWIGYWNLDPLENQLRLMEYWKANEPSIIPFLQTNQTQLLSKGQCLVGRVWHSREPELLQDLSEPTLYLRAPEALTADFKSALAVPLILDHHFMGVIEMISPHRLEFTLFDISLIQGMLQRVLEIFNGKKTDSELRALRDYNEQQTKTLNAFALVLIADTDGTITFVNDHVTKLSQFTREELVGKNCLFLGGNHHSKEHYLQLWNTLLSGITWRGELSSQSKDGTIFWIDATIAPFLNDQGATIQFVLMAKDITDYKTQENHNDSLASLQQLQKRNRLSKKVL